MVRLRELPSEVYLFPVEEMGISTDTMFRWK